MAGSTSMAVGGGPPGGTLWSCKRTLSIVVALTVLASVLGTAADGDVESRRDSRVTGDVDGGREKDGHRPLQVVPNI